MIAILWFHTEMYYAGTDVTPYACYVGNVLAVFFFLSGYLFYSERPFSARHKLTSLVRHLVIPYFLFMLLMVVPKSMAHGQLEELSSQVIQIFTGEASWFVAALIMSQLLFIPLLLMTKGRSAYLCLSSLVSLLLAALFGNSLSPYYNIYNYWHVNEALLGVFLMSLGFLYHKHENALMWLEKPVFVLLLALSVAACKAIILTHDVQLVLGPIIVSHFPLFIIDQLLGIALLTSLFKHLPSIPFMQWTGSHSLVYYFICGGVPLSIGALLHRVGFTNQDYLHILLAFILVYFVSSVIVFLVYKYLPFMVGYKREST